MHIDIVFNYHDDVVEVSIGKETREFGFVASNKYQETQLVSLVTWIARTMTEEFDPFDSGLILEEESRRGKEV